MRKTLLSLAAAALLAPAFAHAQDSGDWIVRARAVHLDSANGDSTGLGLTINNKWLPEVDISYFITPNLAAELILTVPQSQTVSSNGAAIGTFKHLPPTLNLQYHFTDLGAVRPYVGAGINYTRISSVNLLGGGADLSRNSWGLGLQAGVDVPLGSGWLLNLDVKKLQIRADVSAQVEGTWVKAGEFKVDPLLFGIGVGKRF